MNAANVNNIDRDAIASALNGTDPGLAAQLDSAASDRALNNDLVFERALRGAVRKSAAVDMPDNYGLGAVMARIGASRQAQTAAEPRQGWIARALGALRLTPALAVACTVIAAQGAIIFAMLGDNPEATPEYAIVRAIPGTNGGHEPFIRVSFAPATSEQAMRELLNSVRADVVAGPTLFGEYYLLVPAGNAEQVAGALEDSELIESVGVVDDLPNAG